MTATRERRSRITAAALFGLVAAMIGLSFASVPLYRLFCQATGYGGTPRTEGVVRPTHVGESNVTVRFDANVNSSLPWRFQPEQREVRSRLGEETLVHYTASNMSERPVTGTATFNVVPEKVAPYFNKLECFCFKEQTLQPGQQVSMPVLFFVDPALADDPTVRDATTITLSYTFYRTEGGAQASGAAPSRSTGAGG